MNIAITGHKGLIGSYLKERLEKEGNKIILVIDQREGKDLKELEHINPQEKIDLFIHAAAHCKINQSITNPELTFRSNVLGVFQALEFCKRNNIKKFLFFSSSRVLSKERNPYTASKLYGEELCKGYCESYGIDYIIVRPSTVYGPHWDETKRLMHIFITNSLAGKDLEIYGNPKTKTLDFTYVEDFVDATILTLKGDWNKAYDISGEGVYNVKKLAEKIIEKTSSSSKIVIKDAEIAQPQEVSLDISEIKKLGFTPKVSVEEGIDRTITWYQEYLKK